MQQYQLFDELTAEEYQALKDDIRQRGVLVPIELDETGAILDGHHRKRAWEELRAEGETLPDYPSIIRKFANEAEKRNHVRALNILRRHLTKDQQRAQWVAMRRDGMTYQKIAEASGVSKPTVIRALENSVGTNVPTEITGKDGKQYPATKRPSAPQVSIFSASESQRKQALDVLPKIEAEGMAMVKDVEKAKRAERREERIESTPVMPNGKYNVIYADPPWQYGFGFDIYGAADRHYSTMTLDDLCALPIADICEPDCIMFMWTTSPKLFDAKRVIEAWGFEYKTSFVWDKVKHNMGHYNSVRHEFLLVCGKGSFPKQSDTLHDSVITIERSEKHSEKPVYFRELIETMYPKSKRVELFAREQAAGWETWGNEL